MARRWTEDEVTFLKEHYREMADKEIARKLRRTLSAVYHKAEKLGLKKPYTPTYSTCLECGKRFRVSPRTLRRGGGKYCSRKCADLARRVTFNKEEAQRLFEKWKNSRVPLDAFAKKHGHDFRIFARAFKKWFPDEYELELESRRSLNRSYLRGRRFEYKVRDYLRDKGYFVLRSPRSLGPVDLVAIKRGEILFVQCKVRGTISSKEKDELVFLADSVGAKPLVACKGEYWNREIPIFFRELGPRGVRKVAKRA